MAPNMFNRAMDLKLIALVKQYPVLYNSSHEKYMDVDTREVTWHKIGDTLGRPALEFAAIQCQIHFGDYNEEKHKPGLIENLSEYLPAAYSSRSAERKILKLFSKYRGLTSLTAKHLYIKTARALPTYGVAFFLVKEIQIGKKKMVPRLLGIKSESILRLDENTKEVLQVWPLTHVKSYHVGHNDIFTLNFGDYSNKEYSVKTNDALRIRDILEGYIDIIRQRLCGGRYGGHHGHSGAISHEEVRAARGNVITHVANTPGKVVEQTYVGPSKILPFEQGSEAAAGTQVMTVQQLIVTNKGSTAQQVLSGELPLRSDMSLHVVKKLNHMNSNAVRVVTMLGEVTEQNAEEIRNVIANMQQDMPAIQSGIKETAEKQTSEEARKKILGELKQLEDLLDKLGNSMNKGLRDNEGAQEQARQIADLTTEMYLSLDPRTKRRSHLLRQSRQSFVADERLEGTLRRASFIAAAGGASHAVDTATDILKLPYQGAAVSGSGQDSEAVATSAVDKLGKLNAAVALLLVSHADPKYPDYATAVNSMNTIKELLPELATDTRAICHANGVEVGQEILDEVTALCDAARSIGTLTGCDDRDKIQKAATIFSDVSGKLVYILGRRNPRVNADKENEIIELAKQVGDMTTLLLIKASQLTEVAQTDPGAEAVDSAGVHCADAARDLLACAQLTSPTIREAHCQSTLTAAAEALSSSEGNLTRAWKPLVEGQERQQIGEELAACNLELDKAIQRLKNAYAGLEHMQVEDTELSPEQNGRLQFIAGVNTVRGTLQRAMDDLNKTRAASTDSRLRGECDELSRALQMRSQLAASIQPSPGAMPYAQCVQMVHTHREAIEKLNSDEPMSREAFCQCLNYTTAAVCNTLELAAQAGYLISISEQHKEVAKQGLVEVPRMQKLASAVQDSCGLIMQTTGIDLIKEEQAKVSKMINELQQAVREAVNKSQDSALKRELAESGDSVQNAAVALQRVVLTDDASVDKISRCAMSVSDSAGALQCVLEGPALLPPVGPASTETQALADAVMDQSRKLLDQTQSLLKAVRALDDDNDDGPMTWVTYNTARRNIIDAFQGLLDSLRRNGVKAGLVEVVAEIEEEPTASVKSLIQIQEDTARKWLQRRPSNSAVSTAGHQSVTTLIDFAHNMCQDMEDQEKEEMQIVIRESRQLLAQCTHKYDTDTASALMECVRETRLAIEKCAVSRVVEGFLHTEEPLHEFEVLLDAEKDATKRKFLLEHKIAELMSQLGRVKRVAGVVARTGHPNTGRQLEDTTKQTELLAPLLVKAAQERVASPSDQEAVKNYKTLLAQYSEALSKVRNLCDTAVDPLHFVQTAGETMARMREESARHNDPQLCAYTSKAITRLANRVIVVGMSSEVARADPALHSALADAQGKLTAVTTNGQAHGSKLPDWTHTTEEILKTTAEVESALGGENIFKKLPEPDQPIYNAALSLHSAVRGWSARDNEIVGVAKRMAVLMARLSEQMNEERNRELLVTSRSIVIESHEVAATARRLAQECPDARIRNNLLQVCERIPTISGQLKMLTTVKSSALGLQGGEEDREAMNMLVTNAQNLMASVQEVVKAAASASVKIASSRGLKWVRKNY